MVKMQQVRLYLVLGTFLASLLICAVNGQSEEDCKHGDLIDDLDPYPEDDDDDNSKPITNHGLCEDFQSLRDTIDADTLEELIHTHYRCDCRFRRAMRFYKTKRFRRIIEELQESQAFNGILEQLQSAGVNTTDIDRIEDIFTCLQMPVERGDRVRDCKAVRRNTFIEDLLNALPTDDVHDYNAEAHGENNNFGKFRSTVLSPEFQKSLNESLIANTKSLRALRRHGWDIDVILKTMFTILSW